MAGRAKPIIRRAAFWDASVLVPLCIGQRITPKVIALYNTYEVVVWWATPVEIASALARLLRMQQISPSDCVKARKLSQVLADSWFVIQPSDGLRSKAVRLVGRHDLRAADALQLVAALEWCEDDPQGRAFFTANEKLREAALLNGFDAKPL